MSTHKKETEVVLLVAEAEFLKAHDWTPFAPAVPGGEVKWRDAYGNLHSQTGAITIQRGRNLG
jgi:hypothetical protein